ncbi:AP-4 complex subunit epsilon-1 [Mortierella hygrophila]|uniref:AP-4 complex subunit epsilon-1 n=1 Tax=Mortierella hygrophila TaxID=979708 RepID=A0A9P6FEF3_9FUNG|nr:AP-4 complex subunit epsilon-1 [Mortierella hygrophila]
MEFSRKLLSTLTTGQSTDPGRAAADATAFSEESLDALRLNISNPGLSTAAMKDNMLRLIYGEMMGQDVQFGAIYALKLAQSGQTVAEKRAGYLACYLLLQEGNELNIMLVNTLQKDLTSSNYHHVVVALVTLCNMTLPDVIPSMVSHVLNALSHTHESVRKRALIALKSFYTLDTDLILPYFDQIKGSLYDPEPSVMSAALGFFATAVKDHTKEMKELVPVLIKILQQVVDGKLPKGYLYHGMAAPWIQIRCLMIMAQLGHDDLSASTAMTPVVLRVFHKASQGVDAAFGVFFEVLRTLNSFHPAIILELCQSKESTRNPLLSIPRFATSTNPNLKYLGISMLCQVNPDAWSDAWWTEDLLSAVVQALESRDAAIQRRALDLLYRMLTLENAQNIIDRLVYAFFQEQDGSLQGASSQLGSASSSRKNEKHLQQQQLQLSSSFPSRKETILGQILDAAERFGPSEEWYLNLIFDLLARGGTTITLQTAEKVMGVLERGARSPGFDNSRLSILAAQQAMRLLVQEDYNFSSALDSTAPRRQPALAYVVFWALGEFGDKLATLEEKEFDLASVLEALARCLLVNQDPLIQSFVLSALTKLSVKTLPNPIPTSIMNVVRQQCQQHNTTTTVSSSLAIIEVQQRAAEFLMIAELAVS